MPEGVQLRLRQAQAHVGGDGSAPSSFRHRFRQRSFAECDVEADLLVLRQEPVLLPSHARTLFYFLALAWERGCAPRRVQLASRNIDLRRVCEAAEVDLSVRALKGWETRRLLPCDSALVTACLLRRTCPVRSLTLENNHLGADALPLLHGLQASVRATGGVRFVARGPASGPASAGPAAKMPPRLSRRLL